MAAVPSANYNANIVDIPMLQDVIGTGFINEAKLVKSGAITRDSRALGTGTNTINVIREIFNKTSAGQAPASDGTISFNDVTDAECRAPIFVRADGANLLTLQGIMSVGGVIDYTQLSAEISAKGGAMIDDSAIKVVEGIGAANTANQSGSDTIITLPTLNAARWKRGDAGDQFKNGFLFLRSELMEVAQSLGLTAATANTWGYDAQNQIALTGMVQTVQGLYPVVSDKISLASGGNHYAYLLEKGGLVIRGSEAPTIEVAKIPDGFGWRIMFFTRVAMGVPYMGWSGASDVITDTDLAASGNWALKVSASKAKLVPLVRWETDES